MKNKKSEDWLTPAEVMMFVREAVKQAVEELHSKNIPYVIASRDGKGMIRVHPNGQKEFIPYKGQVR